MVVFGGGGGVWGCWWVFWAAVVVAVVVGVGCGFVCVCVWRAWGRVPGGLGRSPTPVFGFGGACPPAVVVMVAGVGVGAVSWGGGVWLCLGPVALLCICLHYELHSSGPFRLVALRLVCGDGGWCWRVVVLCAGGVWSCLGPCCIVLHLLALVFFCGRYFTNCIRPVGLVAHRLVCGDGGWCWCVVAFG